ncbi:hypothetical protein MPH_13841, partial [Macrophomina phaseolina MS6]
ESAHRRTSSRRSQREYEQANVSRDTRRRRMRGALVWEGRRRSGENHGRRGDLSGVLVANAEEDVAEEMGNIGLSFDTRQEGRQGECRGELSEHFERLDARNRENVARAGLGIRTSAELFQAAQSAYEQARAEGSSRRGRGRRERGGLSGKAVANAEEDVVEEVRLAESSPCARQGKRARPRSTDQPQSKHARTVVRRERSDEEQEGDLASVLRSLDEEFAEKERLSHGQAWCAPIPHARKVSTVQEFYKAFHDVRTLPIRTCMICYRKFAEAELEEIDWERWVASAIRKGDGSPFKCSRCFVVGEKIPSCSDCVRHLGRGALSQAAQIHSHLGCEHMFPDELKDLSPVEEKLIALNSCYGFITKYSIPEGRRQSVRYPRHVKGHITVFPNNVQELVTNVLPTRC